MGLELEPLTERYALVKPLVKVQMAFGEKFDRAGRYHKVRALGPWKHKAVERTGCDRSKAACAARVTHEQRDTELDDAEVGRHGPHLAVALLL